MKWIQRILLTCFFLILFVFASALVTTQIFLKKATPFTFALSDVNHASFAIVPGASVLANGKPSDILADRLKVAVQLFLQKKVDYIFVSGSRDNKDYNETKVMKTYLMEKGVPDAAILMDDQGVDTFATMNHARHLFHIDQAIVVTQAYHLPRALYLARGEGIEAVGVASDLQTYVKARYFQFRELFANLKALYKIWGIQSVVSR